MKGKIRISPAEAGDKMIFERTDGAFGGVAAVYMWWSKLVVDAFVLKELLEGLGGLIVESLKTWCKAATFQKVNAAFVACEYVRAGSGSQRLRVDVVAIIVVDDENVAVTTTGRHQEAAREICGDLARNELAIDVEIVRADGSWFTRQEGINGDVGDHVQQWTRDGIGRRRGLCGTEIRALLVQMPLEHRDRDGGVPADLGGREIRPSGQETGVDGRAPC